MTNYAAPTVRRSNGMAVAALVCAIIGIFIFEVILGILALIFGVIGLNRASAGASGRGLAIAGIVIGAIDVLIFIVVIAVASSHGFRWVI